MRRHPNPPGCAVAGALARHVRAARGVDSSVAPRRSPSPSRRYRPLRAPPSTRTSARPNPTPRPRIPRGSRSRRDVRRAASQSTPERRSAGGRTNRTAERVRGAERDSRHARPRRYIRDARRARRETPDRRGPSRTGASDPLITNRSRRVFITLRPKKKIAFLISVDRFFSRRLALHHARRRPPSGHTRVVRRVPHDRLGRDRAGDVQQHLRINVSKQPVQLYRRKV